MKSMLCATFFTTFNYLSKIITKIRLSNHILKIDKVTIEYQFRYISVQKSVSTNIVSNNQLCVSLITFRKYFTNFIIDKLLLKTLEFKNSYLLLKTPSLENTRAKRISCEMYSPWEGELGTSPSTNGKIVISKLKSSRYHKFKIKLCHSL